jgi:hypothetical protein
MTKADGLGVDEFVVDCYGDGCSETEWEEDTRAGYGESGTPSFAEDRGVDFETDKEEEEDETDGGDEVEVWEGRWWEYGGGEAGDSTHHGRTEDDAADDFGDDARLADEFEQPSETLGEDDDDAELGGAGVGGLSRPK